MFRSLTYLFLLASATHAALGQLNRPFPVMDSRVIESMENVRLEATPLRKAGPVLRQEKPWESLYVAPTSLIRYGDEYLLYYLVFVVNDGPRRVENCLAVSRDGLTWERPDLGQVTYSSNKNNNILAGVPSGMGPVTVNSDPTASPEHRFLFLGPDMRTKFGDPGYVESGLALFSSPDGRNWKQSSPILAPFSSDSANQILYDTAKQKYVAYVRAFPDRRAVAYYEPPDIFQPWPIKPAANNEGEIYNSPQGPVRTIYIRDELPLVVDWSRPFQVYNPAIHVVDGMYLAFPDIFRIFPGVKHADKARFPESELFAWPNDGLVAPRLYISEDGTKFRPVGTSPYIDIGAADALDAKQIRMATGFISHGDEIWQYYGGQQTSHHIGGGRRPRKGSTIMRAIQRKDGFAGFVAGPDGGQVLTVPVRVEGRHLHVNYDAGAWGEVQVELLDADGRPVAGYALGDSAPMVGNVVYAQVLWSDGRDLGSLNGKMARIRFHVKNARLFSFKFM